MVALRLFYGKILCEVRIKMKREELLSWAIKGLSTEIYELERSIEKGKKYLEEYRNGGQPKTKKTPEEIEKIIFEKKKEFELLVKKRFDLSWERDVDR
jgi:hypothetical protein